MKYQFVFGNPVKGSSIKHHNSVKSKERSSGMAISKQEKKKLSSLKKKIRAALKMKNPLTGKEKKEFEKEAKAFFNKKLKDDEKREAQKSIKAGEQLLVDILDAQVAAKNKGGNVAKKKNTKKKPIKKKAGGRKKVAKKATKKVAKKATRKKTSKKVAKKATRKKASKVVSRKRKAIRKRRKSVAKKAKQVKRKKPRYSKLKKAITRKRVLKAKKKHTYRKYVKGKKGKKHKFIFKRLNPIGGNMASQFEKFTGHSLPEAGGLALGGVLYGATNSIMAKIPGVKIVHQQLLKIPVVGSALPTLLAGALLNYFGDKQKIKALSMIGKGLVGASVVGMGVNASQKIPGLAGVDFTMDGYDQLGINEADFGQSEADFGELIDYNTEALSGVDYTAMEGVDFTMDGYGQSEADFGELIQMNDEALSGQLG